MATSRSNTNVDSRVNSVVEGATKKVEGTINSGREKIDAASQKIQDAQAKVTGIVDDVSGAIQDPFGTVVKKTLNKINSLVLNVEKKVDQLIKDTVKKVDSKGRVNLEGNNLVITVTRADLQKAAEIKVNVENKITSIQNTLNVLRTTINSLSTVTQAINTYKRILDIQEIILAANPVSGPIFLVLKKGIKLVFLKEILKEYLKVVSVELAQNKQVVTRLIERFRGLQVSIKIQDEADKGNFITTNTAEEMLADELFGEPEVTQESESFTDQNFNKYILKVEKYDSKQLIARAFDKESGMIKAQTAPSYFSTSKDLLEEIKTILNQI
jgi:rRNA processing protein Gar1